MLIGFGLKTQAGKHMQLVYLILLTYELPLKEATLGLRWAGLPEVLSIPHGAARVVYQCSMHKIPTLGSVCVFVQQNAQHTTLPQLRPADNYSRCARSSIVYIVHAFKYVPKGYTPYSSSLENMCSSCISS